MKACMECVGLLSFYCHSSMSTNCRGHAKLCLPLDGVSEVRSEHLAVGDARRGVCSGSWLGSCCGLILPLAGSGEVINVTRWAQGVLGTPESEILAGNSCHKRPLQRGERVA